MLYLLSELTFSGRRILGDLWITEPSTLLCAFSSSYREYCETYLHFWNNDLSEEELDKQFKVFIKKLSCGDYPPSSFELALGGIYYDDHTVEPMDAVYDIETVAKIAKEISLIQPQDYEDEDLSYYIESVIDLYQEASEKSMGMNIFWHSNP